MPKSPKSILLLHSNNYQTIWGGFAFIRISRKEKKKNIEKCIILMRNIQDILKHKLLIEINRKKLTGRYKLRLKH